MKRTNQEMAQSLRLWAEQALKWKIPAGNPADFAATCEAAATALIEKAEREEEERPVTLEEQERAIMLYLDEHGKAHNSDGVCRHVIWGNCNHAAAAADTLRTLRRDGGKWLKAFDRCDVTHNSAEVEAAVIFTKLGVEPK